MAVSTEATELRVRTSWTKRSNTKLHPFLFIAPSVIMLALLLVLPISRAFIDSFNSDVGWGLDNYNRAFRNDYLARIAIRHTFVFAFFSVVGQYVIGFAIALLMNEKLPMRGMFQGAFPSAMDVPRCCAGNCLAMDFRWSVRGPQRNPLSHRLLRSE